ncbi:MAG: hypothetical protein OEW95_10010 [Candidatus Bathyarchaeota archaeon]|nr:hypothetical protein [Candidatus Bathyarchaeota archaeon]
MCVPSVGLFVLPEEYVALLGIWVFAVLCASTITYPLLGCLRLLCIGAVP